jgi:hypothetical protein
VSIANPIFSFRDPSGAAAVEELDDCGPVQFDPIKARARRNNSLIFIEYLLSNERVSEIKAEKWVSGNVGSIKIPDNFDQRENLAL